MGDVADIQNIDPEDHATLDTLALGEEAGSGSRTLADMIFSKMQGGAASHEMEEEGECGPEPRGDRDADATDNGPPDPRKGLNPKVVEVYTK